MLEIQLTEVLALFSRSTGPPTDPPPEQPPVVGREQLRTLAEQVKIDASKGKAWRPHAWRGKAGGHLITW